MKSLYLPESLYLEELPKRSTGCQPVLFALLSHSDPDYKPVWPSIPTICKLSGIKSETTVRAKNRELESAGIISIKTTTEKTKNGLRSWNMYFFTFQKWIEIDLANGKPGRGSNIPKMVELTARREAQKAVKDEARRLDARIDRVTFDFKTVSDRLKIWENHLEFVGVHNKTIYFNAMSDLSPSFVEEQFRNEGFSIKVNRKAG